jgi:hypothetical protein
MGERPASISRRVIAVTRRTLLILHGAGGLTLLAHPAVLIASIMGLAAPNTGPSDLDTSLFRAFLADS